MNEAERLKDIRKYVDLGGLINNGDAALLLSILDRHKSNLLAATDRVVELEAESKEQRRQLRERLSRVELKLMVEAGKIIENPALAEGAHPTSFTGRIAAMKKRVDELKAEQERREKDVRALVAVILDDNVTDYGDICPGKMNEALATVRKWLPTE